MKNPFIQIFVVTFFFCFAGLLFGEPMDICFYGYALCFDGLDDFVLVPRHESLEPDEITIELWANLGSNHDYHSRLLRKAGHMSNGYIIAAKQGDDRRMQLRVDNDGLVRAADVQDWAVYVGQWHHFAGVYTLNSASFYVDGVEVSKVDHNKGVMKHEPLTDLLIGCGLYPSTECFGGIIDDVRIWSRPLDQQEIFDNMNIPLVGDEEGLIAYWDFNEGQGQKVCDLSGNNNDGYLGTDPEGEDSADPKWIESEAPVGICSSYIVVKRSIEQALTHKLSILEELAAAIEEENTAIEILEEMFENAEEEELNKSEIMQVKQRVHSAGQFEKICREQLIKSIQRLEVALGLLTGEIDDQQFCDEFQVEMKSGIKTEN